MRQFTHAAAHHWFNLDWQGVGTSQTHRAVSSRADLSTDRQSILISHYFVSVIKLEASSRGLVFRIKKERGSPQWTIFATSLLYGNEGSSLFVSQNHQGINLHRSACRHVTS